MKGRAIELPTAEDNGGFQRRLILDRQGENRRSC